jgi:hypothetical protein
MQATLTILFPGVEKERDAKPELAARLRDFAGKRIALVDNGKVNAGLLLSTVAARLKALGAAESRTWRKQHAAEGADRILPEILQWKPDLVLGALGD